MAYSKYKTWIPGEILTAADLNGGFTTNTTNENDLDSRLTTEVTARTALEGEFDTYVAAAVMNVVDNIWIYANTAPAGWTIKSGTTDALLACKGGSNAYNTTGGQQIGTWTQPNHTHTSPWHGHASAAHKHLAPVGGSGSSMRIVKDLAGGETGAELHLVNYISGTEGALVASVYYTNETTPANTGGYGGVTGSSATAVTYRPYANLGIIIEKS